MEIAAGGFFSHTGLLYSGGQVMQSFDDYSAEKEPENGQGQDKGYNGPDIDK